jgi:hypothetical protein
LEHLEGSQEMFVEWMWEEGITLPFPCTSQLQKRQLGSSDSELRFFQVLSYSNLTIVSFPHPTNSCPPVLWFGCGLFPKESCAGSLILNITVLKGGRIFKRWGIVGVTGSWLPWWRD